MSNKLFVGNLSFQTTENDLQDAFAQHGTVVEANLMMDRMSGRPRGFGFVTMSTAEEAEKAIEALNGKDLGGRALTVNVARPREERTGGGGGGGGGRATVAVAVAAAAVVVITAAAAAAAVADATVIDQVFQTVARLGFAGPRHLSFLLPAPASPSAR